jgi:REP element-mobilizing transposase RayT
LCGLDRLTGTSYEHRRDWLEQRLLRLGQIFCIDVCAYAVMTNHYHAVLHINRQCQADLTITEVLQRWSSLFNGNTLVCQYLQGERLGDAQLKVIEELAGLWRQRLGDLSWFMRVLNEAIAREANAEDQCTGRFWEGRFKSQALLDEQALFACMAYVDLNPIRAKMAATLETSDHTSIKKRMDHLRQTSNQHQKPSQPQVLFPFVGSPRQPMQQGLPFKLVDYLELLDWTGRSIRQGKRGVIDDPIPNLLERLNIATPNWLNSARHFEDAFKLWAGTASSIRAVCSRLGYRRVPTLGMALSQ